MSATKTGAASGCVVWIVLIGLLSTCLLPVSIGLGSITSFSNVAIQVTGKWLCPAGTQPEQYSYETTMNDENGIPQPATAYELHCVNAAGEVVKQDPIVYGFLWTGLFAAAGLLLAVLLSFALAAPAGVLIGRLVQRRTKASPPPAISPS